MNLPINHYPSNSKYLGELSKAEAHSKHWLVQLEQSELSHTDLGPAHETTDSNQFLATFLSSSEIATIPMMNIGNNGDCEVNKGP
jgi:hypothetical protein